MTDTEPFLKDDRRDSDSDLVHSTATHKPTRKWSWIGILVAVNIGVLLLDLLALLKFTSQTPRITPGCSDLPPCGYLHHPMRVCGQLTLLQHQPILLLPMNTESWMKAMSMRGLASPGRSWKTSGMI